MHIRTVIDLVFGTPIIVAPLNSYWNSHDGTYRAIATGLPALPPRPLPMRKTSRFRLKLVLSVLVLCATGVTAGEARNAEAS